MPATDSIEGLATEEINPRTVEIDLLATGEILRRINEEDALVAGAVARELPAIEAVVERVVAALRRARVLGAGTAALVGNRDGPVAAVAALVIAPYTGPEVISGSTRMKAGTAQKLVLNMISTAAMIRAGRTFGNLMVDMKARDSKLRRRAERVVDQGADEDLATAAWALSSADGEIKTAIVLLRAHTSAAEARRRLDRAHGVLRQVLQEGQPDTARPAIAHFAEHGVKEGR